MNVKELYDYITSQMTPEEALMKLLEGPMLSYDKLKFDKGEEVHPLLIIANAAMDMGWNISFEKNDNKSSDVCGLHLGTPDYMNRVVINLIKDN